MNVEIDSEGVRISEVFLSPETWEKFKRGEIMLRCPDGKTMVELYSSSVVAQVERQKIYTEGFEAGWREARS